MNSISVVCLTKNSERYLSQVLKAIEAVNEVIIYDTGSVDRTLSIAASFPNVTTHAGTLDGGFGATRNRAATLAAHEWILALDSDEIPSRMLIDEILHMTLNSSCVYSFPRHNYYRGKLIRGCGWYPDRVLRLYNRKHTQFSNAHVHEAVITQNMQIVPLQGHVTHTPYNSIHDFLAKMQHYSTLYANDHAGKKNATTATAITHALFAFVKSYFLKRGILLGSQGFEISLYNGMSAFYKYLKLRDILIVDKM